MQILLFRANGVVLHAQFIADLVEQFGRLSAWGIFQAIWGVMNKLISIKSNEIQIILQIRHLNNAYHANV